MSIRVASGLLAVSGKNNPSGFTMSGLRVADSDRNKRWGHTQRRTGQYRGTQVYTVLAVV